MNLQFESSIRRTTSFLAPILLATTLGFGHLAVQGASRARPEILPLAGVVRIEEDPKGQATQVTLDEAKEIPKSVFDLLPDRDARKLTRSQIRQLTEKHGLFTEWEVNPNLRF